MTEIRTTNAPDTGTLIVSHPYTVDQGAPPFCAYCGLPARNRLHQDAA